MEDKEYINLKLTKREFQTIQIALVDQGILAQKNNNERLEFYTRNTLITILAELRYQSKNIKEK